jgi:gliding motility-associated-like protein
MDGVDLNPLPFTQTLEANVNYTFITAPSSIWYVFSHWELNNNTLAPDDLAEEVILNLQDEDLLVAIYNEIEHYTLNVDVEPAGIGEVTLNGNPLALPYSEVVEGGIDYSFSTSTDDIFYEFSHWEWNGSPLAPDEFTMDMILTLEQDEDVVAVFVPKANYEITIQVVPPFSGTVMINEGDTTVQNTWTGTLWGDVFNYDFTASAAPYHNFLNWESLNNFIADPEAKEISMVFFTNDTLYAYFEEDPYSWYVPNSFTPNNDGINDFFLPQGNAFEIDQYSLQIFNRWGEKVFETNDPYQPWDGGNNGGDYYVQDEIYFYQIKVKPANELSAREYDGHIIVIR